jgi:pyruvate formate lyase activating enzyme
MEEIKGNVFDIQRFSLHDGPGIRTTVFLKGCPLSCIWCQNPESINIGPELMFYEKRCVKCGVCIKACPNKVHKIINGDRSLRRELCRQCGKCAQACCAEALVMCGKSMTVSEVVDEVEKDKLFYRNSGGGVTLSGGEPLFQAEFSLELLNECKNRGIKTAVETSGYLRWEIMEKALGFLDLVIYDVKQIDSARHRQYTGVSNELILANLEKLTKKKVPLSVRLPIIPLYNDLESDLEKTANFLNKLGIKKVELLPYNELAESKWSCLGKEYKMNGTKPLSKETMQKIIDKMKQ